MNAWDALSVAALIGTEKKPLQLPALPTGLENAIRNEANAAPERQLLDAAAALGTWQAAGMTAVGTTVPEAMAFGEERSCSKRLVELLLEATQKQHQDCLGELFKLMRHQRLTLPALNVPRFLDFGKQRSDLHEALSPVLGRRGVWLASQREEWAWVTETADPLNPALWESENKETRIRFLRALRRQDPAQARTLIEGCWKSEAAAERKELISIMAEGLSSGDEAFLESALSDKSKEVLLYVRGFLGSLPESAYCARMAVRLSESILISESGIDFKFPDQLDASARRDGLGFRKTAPDEQGGQKACYIREVVSAVSLRFWEEKFGKEVVAIHDFVKKSDWGKDILAGLGLATVRQRSHAWVLALRNTATSAFAGLVGPPQRFFSILTHQELNKLIAEMGPSGPLPGVAEACQRPWSFEATMTYSRWLGRLYQRRAPQDFRHGSQLVLLAGCGDYRAYHEVCECFIRKEQNPKPMPKDIHEALETYRLRHEFYKEITQ